MCCLVIPPNAWLCTRLELRFQQVRDGLIRLRKDEKSRDLAHKHPLRFVGDAVYVIERFHGEYNSHLQALISVKEESFGVLQRLYANKILQNEGLVALR
ncbi:hypothetical protein Plhal304r1_c011g0044541 [Plasmopara halstedii]